MKEYSVNFGIKVVNVVSLLSRAHVYFESMPYLFIMDIFWVGGHVNIRGNNLADHHAKQAAEHAKQKAVALTKSRVKSAIKSAMVICWQRMWNLHSESQTHTLLPKVSLTNKFADISVKAQKIRNRLILNHSLLKDRMHRILPKAHISST